MPTGFGAATVNGIAIHIFESEQSFFPDAVQEVIEEITHIPFSNINIRDNGGLGPTILAVRLRVAPADKTAFEALNGQLVALVYYGGSITAKLKITAKAIHALMQEYRYGVELSW